MMQDSADDGNLIAAVPGQDDSDVGRVGHVVHARAGGGHRAVVFRGKGKRMTDAIGITVHALSGEAGKRGGGAGKPALRSRDDKEGWYDGGA
jgi:hypothetical protein